MLVLGNKVGVTEYTINSDGCWVLLDELTKEKYCYNVEGDAWSLAIGQNNTLYLGSIDESDSYPKLASGSETILHKRGFNFSRSISRSGENNFSFTTQDVTHIIPSKNPNKSVCTNPFIFGESTLECPKIVNVGKKDSKVTTLSKWFKGDIKR